MKKIFTSWYAPLLLLLPALAIGLTVAITYLQEFVTIAFIAAFAIGLGMQAWVQYKTGKCGVHWTVPTFALFAMIIRAIYMIRTGQYWLSFSDLFGVFILVVLQLQLAGFLLKKTIAPEDKDMEGKN